MLKKVIIEPSCTARRAMDLINKALAEYQDEETLVDFELMLETAAQFNGSNAYAYYTLVIMLYDRSDDIQ